MEFKSMTKANGLYNYIINTQFIMSLILCNNELNFIDNLTILLSTIVY